MNNSIPAGAPPSESAPEEVSQQKQWRDPHDELFQDQRCPLFNLLHTWYCEAHEELAAKEQTLRETKATHQTELKRRDAEISSLTAQVAKLNLALEDATRKLEEATRTIETMNGNAVNDKSAEVSLAAGNIAANAKVNAKENMSLLNNSSSVWDKNYAYLVAYKQQHGNCDVSTLDKENENIGKWVNNLRHKFKKGELSDERVAMLDEIGFVWDPKKQKKAALWAAQYSDLVAFKQEFGHCMVPQRYEGNGGLGLWVNYVRQQFKRGKLSDERVTMLDEIGFAWKLKSHWTTRYNDLVAYKKRHGHCYFPSKYEENASLSRWVHNVRHQYKKGKLSNERVAMLDEIGFA